MISGLLIAGMIGVQRLGYDEFAFLRRGTMLRVYELPAVKRGLFVVFVDLALTFVTAYVAIGLKTDVWSFTAVQDSVLEIATTLAPVTVAAFLWRGMYRAAGRWPASRISPGCSSPWRSRRRRARWFSACSG